MDLNKISLFLISALSIFAVYCAFSIGLAWDEPFHHINGNFRADYLKSFGKLKNYNYESVTRFYPGLYDTINFALSNSLIKIFTAKYLFEIKHLINLTFSLFTIFGLFLLAKKIFNKNVGYLAALICLVNPFFFGHMSINPKDSIVCFSLVWFAYYTYCYCGSFNTISKKRILCLIAAGLFMGFGQGVRPTFFIITLPIILSALFYILKYSKYSTGKFLIKTFSDIVIFLVISVALMVLAWPQVLEGSYHLLKEVLFLSKNWTGPSLGIMNGEFYETANTPRTYILNFFIFRIPFFILIAISMLIISLIFDGKFYKKKFKNFKGKLIVIIFTFLFPILIAVFLKIKIYDGIRLFLFLIPIISIMTALSIYYVFENSKINKYIKIIKIGVIASFCLFLSRFIVLSPYHYDYSNFLNFNFKNTINLYEHDYWGTSYKELVQLISKNKDLSELKITTCAADPNGTRYLFRKYLGKKAILVPYEEADYIMMINRVGYDLIKKDSCFTMYPGEDIVSVNRLGVQLSVLRKIK